MREYSTFSRHLDTQQIHAVLDDLGHIACQHIAEGQGLGALGAEDGVVVVERVEELGQLVAVVADGSRIVVAARISHCHLILAELLDQLHLLVVGLIAAEGVCHARRLAHDAADARIGILDEGTRVAIEVDGLRGIEEHVLSCIHLEDEVLQRAKTDDPRHVLTLLLRHLRTLALLVADLAGVADHLGYQLVGIDDRSLAALHLAIGQIDHAVGEVDRSLPHLKPRRSSRSESTWKW